MFKNPDAIARYAEGPPRFTPGFDALHRMSAVELFYAAFTWRGWIAKA